MKNDSLADHALFWQFLSNKRAYFGRAASQGFMLAWFCLHILNLHSGMPGTIFRFSKNVCFDPKGEVKNGKFIKG